MSFMTPAEDVKRLKRLIRQYETVYKTTLDADQRGRAEKQLKELKDRRDKLLEMHVIDPRDIEEEIEKPDEYAGFPLLKRFSEEAAGREGGWASGMEPSEPETMNSAQKEMRCLALYTGHFEREFLPFLTGKQLKLDFKFSMERDSFYRRFQELLRKIADLREEQGRLAEGAFSKGMEREMRLRGNKLQRLIAVDASKFFRAIEHFADELIEDARGDGVKCLNCDSTIYFDGIEGARLLEKRIVLEALQELLEFSVEVVAYLNVPEIETQEKGRADRY